MMRALAGGTLPIPDEKSASRQRIRTLRGVGGASEQ